MTTVPSSWNRRTLIGRLVVAFVVLALSVITVAQSIDNSQQRKCYERSAYNRSDANNLDWAAMDKLVAAIVISGGTADTQKALADFQETRAETLSIRKANSANPDGDQC